MHTNISNNSPYDNLFIINPEQKLYDLILLWKSHGLDDTEILARVKFALKELQIINATQKDK